MNKFSNYLWGGLLVVIGIIIGLNSFGITNIDLLFDGWWTLFIIIPCSINLFNEKEEKIGNIIGLVIGIFLLLSVRGIVNFSILWKLLLPVIFILIGLFIMFRGKFGKDFKMSDKKNVDEYCATFSEQKVDLSDKVFKECDLSAIFGSLKCDIKDSKIGDEAFINVLSLFGSTNIIVPKDAEVIIKSIPIFGSVKNNINNKDNNKVIYINAISIFGGVDIND